MNKRPAQDFGPSLKCNLRYIRLHFESRKESMNQEQYIDILNRLRTVQGELNNAVFQDLQRLEGAESESTKVGVDRAYEQGMKEAWELAKTIATRDGMSFKKISECFGVSSFTEVYEMDVKEALQKYREYMQKQKEEAEESGLRVGDEVECEGVKVIVTRILSDYSFSGIDRFGSTYSERETNRWSKTGKHYHEIPQLLEKMKPC